MLRRDVPEPGADGEQQVRFADQLRQPRIHAETCVADVVRGAVVEAVLATKRGRDRHGVRLDVSLQEVPGFRGPAGAAEDRERPLRSLEHPLQPLDVRRRGIRSRNRHRRGVDRRDALVEQVLRQPDHDRALSPRERRCHSAAQELRQPLRFLRLHRPLGRRAEEGANVDLLPRLAPAERARHLAHEHKQRCGVLRRHVQPGHGVGAAGTAGNEADADAPRGLGVRFGHHRGAALLPADDEPDLRHLAQRVQHREKAFSRHREDAIHAVAAQQLDDRPSGRHRRPAVARHEYLLDATTKRAAISARRSPCSTSPPRGAAARRGCPAPRSPPPSIPPSSRTRALCSRAAP